MNVKLILCKILVLTKMNSQLFTFSSLFGKRDPMYIYWPNKNSSNTVIDHLTSYLPHIQFDFISSLGDSHCTLTIERILLYSLDIFYWNIIL